EAERNRRRELEERINGILKCALPPTLERAAQEWMKSRKNLVRPGTDRMAHVALHQVLPAFGSKLLCYIDARSIQEYQQRRLSQAAQGRTINIETGVLRQILKAYEYWRPMEGGCVPPVSPFLQARMYFCPLPTTGWVWTRRPRHASSSPFSRPRSKERHWFGD